MMSIRTLCCTYDLMLRVHFSSSRGADANLEEQIDLKNSRETAGKDFI